MWRIIIIVYTAVFLAVAQNGRSSAHQDHNGHGWDIRLAVPGEPGSDYPTLGSIPRTSFSCAGKEPGYYADLETSCQVFRVCTIGSTYGFQSFLCPNGTLFNQAVFVCDWWMNVNCQQSERLFNNNNDKFGNLRLGPQLMKDIKKMLTHPMRNPYDKMAMKSNLIVMQDYKPPFGQLFPNGALIAGPERPPNNIYVPAKQIQPPVLNTNDIAFAASTLSPRYVPAAFNAIQQTTQRDVDVFQRQRQYNQNVQSNRQQSSQLSQPNTDIYNGHAVQYTQTNRNSNVQFSQPTQSYNNGNVQYGQKQIGYTRPTQAISTQNLINIQRGQVNQQISQFTNNNQNPSRLTNGKQAEYSIAYTKQQYNSNQDKQPYIYNQPQLQFDSKSGNAVKQNLVRANVDVPSTVIAKTLTLKRIIQDPKHGTPKSRITVKTWIVKPSKSAKLIDSAPYTYERPTQPPAQKLIDTTPYSYFYNKPSTLSQKIISEPDEPYVYTKPTAAAKQILSTSREPTRNFATLTTPRPTISRLYQTPTTAQPTLSSKLYLPPTTYNPSSRLYLPPSSAPLIISKQYLTPTATIQSTNYQSGQLRASPTTSSPNYALPETEDYDTPPYSSHKQTNFNINPNNLTFTDILTKQRLDNTVGNIVKDTSNILNAAPPVQFEQFRDINTIDYPEENYLPPQPSTDSGESLTLLPPTTVTKSARLISSPSVDLEPPIDKFTNNQNINQFSNLPFYKESLAPRNTIERTVSLKISIPEKIADYLFKSHNDSDFDKLEILNTGSSNYLVLTNNFMNKNSGTNFIPIGKLISDKQSNISNSQALVFSLLADSINVAKDYNLSQQGKAQTTPSQTQFQNMDNEELDQITNKISQLTSSQFSGSNQANYKSANLVATTPATDNSQGYKYNSPAANHSPQIQYQTSQNDQYKSRSNLNNPEQVLSRYQDSNSNVDTNSKQLYSGQLYQLPVPEVTSQIYNKQSISNLLQTNKIQQNQHSDENIDLGNSNSPISSKDEVEIAKSTVSFSQPARIEVAPTSELDHFNSQENFNKFINSNNGISAQLQDKIVGTIPHPLEDNKVVTYKKDESYYVYTKLDNSVTQDIQNQVNSIQSNIAGNLQNAKLIQENNLPNIVAFQLIPSVSYQLEDEKEQQKLLNAFQIDEFGKPKQKANLIDKSNQPVLTSSVDYTVDHTLSDKQNNGQFNEVSNLYAGPSSYSAPQATVGKLGSRQDTSSRLELEDNSNGYAKISPTPIFTFK